MSRQAGILVGLGVAVAAAIAGALFLVLSDPAPQDGAPGGDDPVAAASTDDAPVEQEDLRGGRRHARIAGAASLFGVVQRAADEQPAAGQAVRVVGEGVGKIEVATDASGAFRFEALPPGGPYAVEVDAAGYAPIRLPGIALDRSEERDLGILLLDLAVRVEVHVHDMADAALEGAQVSAYAAPQIGFGFDWTKAMAQMGQEPVAVARVETGADGVAVFDDLASGSWTFVARKEGYAATGAASLELRSRVTPDPVKLHLAHGHTLTGRVLDENDVPVAGALVMGGGGNAWDLGAAPLRVRSTTGEDGVYTLTALRAGDAPIWVAPPGATPSQIVTLRIPDVARFDIHLRAGGVLQGRVTMQDSGEPVEGARVRAMSWGPAGARTGEAVTDADGHYSIDDLSEGNVGNVTVEKEGLAQIVESNNGWNPTAFRSGVVVEQDVQMARGAVLTGRVTGPDGSVSGARVMVMFQRAAGNFDQKQATTDGEGRYRIDTLCAGRYIVQASAPGLYVPDFPTNWWMAFQGGSLPKHLSGELVAGAESERDIELLRGTTISGRVETSEGEPVAGAQVRAASSAGWMGAATEPAVSAADGTFQLEGVVPAPQVQLVVAAKGMAAQQRDPLDMSDGAPVTGAVVVVDALPLVRGRVTSSAGELPEDAWVQVFAVPDSGNVKFPFDPAQLAAGAEYLPVRRDGSYEARVAVTRGAFSVRAGAPGLAPATSERTKLEDGVHEYEVDVQLGEGFTLTGRVASDVTSEGIADAHVRVTAVGGNDPRETQMMMMGDVVQSAGGGGGAVVVAVTDESGAFQVSGLARGDFRVAAKADGFVEGSVDARTPSTSQVDLPLAPELQIDGTVAFGDGRPVEGVTVTARSGSSGGSQPGMFPGGGNGTASTTTDTRGHFVLRGLRRGQYVLQVSVTWGGRANVQPFESQPTAAGATDVRLVVQEGLRIAGRVVNESGDPVSQCWVWGNPERTAAGRPAQPVSAQAKADGSFELVGLPTDAESYTLNFRGQGMGGGLVPVVLEKVKPGTTGLEVVMKSGLRIEGVIKSADGKALGQAWLTATPIVQDGDRTPRNSSNAQVDANGSFSIGGLQPGHYSLQLQSWGTGGNRQLVLQGGQDVAAGSSGLKLIASAGATISGVVVDENGSPVAGATVAASPPQGGRSSGTRANADGEFEITALADGESYTVMAEAAGRIRAKVDNVAAGTSGLRIEVRSGVNVSGVALGADGARLAGAFVYLNPVDRPELNGQQARTDGEGNFTVGGLDQGVTYKVRARVRVDNTWTTLDLGNVKGGDTGVQLRPQ